MRAPVNSEKYNPHLIYGLAYGKLPESGRPLLVEHIGLTSMGLPNLPTDHQVNEAKDANGRADLSRYPGLRGW